MEINPTQKGKEMNGKILVFKYGGNAMLNEKLKKKVLENICRLRQEGFLPVIVHGGGPFIKKALEKAGIVSEFVDGHRKTSMEAIHEVEMALKGEVNSDLVGMINALGYRAVGLSGKDGQSVVAKKRYHYRDQGDIREKVDLGQVGDVDRVDTTLIRLLLEADYVPVLTCIAQDEKGDTFNINGDMFAGHIAGALRAMAYIVLTDVDGLQGDIDDPSTLIEHLHPEEVPGLIEEEVIQGGMLPKVESCLIALNQGASQARIINGTVPEQISKLSQNIQLGTKISYGH